MVQRRVNVGLCQSHCAVQLERVVHQEWMEKMVQQQEGNLVKRSVFGVCGVDASNQEELRPGRLAGGPHGPHEEGAHGPQQLQVGRDGEGLRRTRWPAIQSCHHPEESCLHKLILIVLAVYLYGK